MIWGDALRKSHLKIRVYNNLGVSHANEQEYDAAIRYYQRALLLQPRSSDAVETYVNLGNAYSDTGHDNEAVAMYERALSLNPDLPGIYYNLGVVLERKGNISAAIRLYDKALQLLPSYEQPAMRLHALTAEDTGGAVHKHGP